MLSHTFAVVICYNGAQWLSETLSRLAEQQPEEIVVVDTGSTDGSLDLVAAQGIRRIVIVPPSTSFAGAVQRGLDSLAHVPTEDDFVWIVHDDSAPTTGTLDQLLLAAEQNSNAAVFGPKLYEWEDRRTLQSFGLTMTRTGIAVNVAKGERDQAQFDDRADTLGLSTAGLLVRWLAWNELQGLDPVLDHTDDGLDFGVRARLAGYRVVRVPDAVMRHVAQAPRGIRRHDTASSTRRVRQAQLYRQLVYAAQPWAFILWLLLLPGALVRSVVALFRKRPDQVFDEWAAAGRLTVAIGDVRRARSRLVRRERWSRLVPLRMTTAAYRQWRMQVAPRTSHEHAAYLVKAPFWSSSGPWVVLGALVLSILTWLRLLGAAALSGGGALPLSPHLADVWANAVQMTVDGVSGTSLAPSPAALLLALLATLSPGAPSLAVVVLWIVALPVAALGAYLLAGIVTTRSWARAAVAIAWTLFPPFLAALAGGEVYAVIAHLALPFALRLVMLAVQSALTRSQRITCAAGAGLLLAVATIGSPATAALSIVLWIIGLALWRRAALVWVAIPTIVVWLPTAIAAAADRQWFRLLVDPGVLSQHPTAKLWQAVLGMPEANPLLAPTSMRGPAWMQAVGPLLPSLAVVVWGVLALAVLIALVRGSMLRGGIGLIALLGAGITSLAVQRIELLATGLPSMWAGAALSVGAVMALPALAEVLGEMRVAQRTTVTIAVVLIALPTVSFFAAAMRGDTAVAASPAVRIPAIVAAQPSAARVQKVLIIDVQDDGALRLAITGGDGETLDGVNNAARVTTIPENGSSVLSPVVTAAAGLVLGTDPGAAQTLAHQDLTFVLVQGDADNRIVQRVSSNRGLLAIGATDFGHLWQLTEGGGVPVADTSSAWRYVLPIGIVGVIYLLLAIPTSRLPWRDEVPRDPLADERGLDASDPFAEDVVEGERDV